MRVNFTPFGPAQERAIYDARKASTRLNELARAYGVSVDRICKVVAKEKKRRNLAAVIHQCDSDPKGD